MNIIKTIALSAVLLGGVSAANASPFDNMNAFDSLLAIDSASSATVLSVSGGAASSLKYDNDVSSVQQRIMNNKRLLATVANQGFDIDQIVGVSGTENDLTLYAY
ncbi:hypothetical protein [Devosia sp. CAU 1758]